MTVYDILLADVGEVVELIFETFSLSKVTPSFGSTGSVKNGNPLPHALESMMDAEEALGVRCRDLCNMGLVLS